MIPVTYRLFNLFGWYQSNPVNITADEVKHGTGTIAGLENAITDTKSRITDGFKLSNDPVRQMSDLSDMADSDSVGPLLDVYAEEATQPDINSGKCLWYECNDSTVEKELNEMYDRINAEDYMLSIAFNVAGSGNDFRRVLYNDKGIQQMVGVSCREMRRLWEPTTRRLLGFRWIGQKPQEEHAPYTEDKTIFPPWDFIHFRRIYSSTTEYGLGILSKLYGLWRKLEMSTDQMVLYRLHTMPNRWAMFVDVGDQDVTDAMETLHTYATMVRQKFTLNSGSMDSRYDPPALDSVIYIPVRSEETNTKIELMAGDKDVPDIPDIEHLKKSLYGGARIPAAYVGHGDDSGNGLAKASLVSQDIRFARMIRVIRRPIAAGFYRLGQLHLALTGKNPEDYQIKVKMSRISSLEEEVNMAILEKQVGMAQAISQLCKDLNIPNREIIDLVFREYLSVPRYFLEIAKLGSSLQGIFGNGEEANNGNMGGGLGGPPLPSGDFEDSLEGDMDEIAPPEPIQDSVIRFTKPTPKQASNLKATITMLRERSKTLTEKSLGKVERKVISEFNFRIRTLVRDHSEIITSKKSSLVEDYTGDRFHTEPVITTNKTLNESIESGGFKIAGAIGYVETSLTESGDAQTQQHEAVQMVKRRRGNG